MDGPNDRAFVFDPAVEAARGDTAVANGMTRLLANTSTRARDCLLSQMGKVAARSTCSSPWAPSLDLQANIRPAGFGLDRRLTISVIAMNTLTGLDQLLHGNNNLSRLGAARIPGPHTALRARIRSYDQYLPVSGQRAF